MSTVLDWILRQRFRAMLLTLLMMLVVAPVLQQFPLTRFALDAMRTLLYITAFFVVFKERRHRALAIGLAIPAVAAGWAVALFDANRPPGLEVSFHLISAVFLAVAVVALLHAVYQGAEVTTDNVCGAFCGYLLVGIIFGHIYCIAELLVPNSFIVSDEALHRFPDDARDHYLLFYFSLVTITTVGYGDITAATAPTRGLAMVEAVAGQFYIAVLVAELIGKRVSQAMSPPTQGPSAPP